MRVTKLFMILLLIIFGTMSRDLAAQDGKQLKFLRVGSLQSYFTNFGSEIETGRTNNANEQLDGLAWDAQFRNQDTQAAKALYIGTTNYYDRVLKTTVPFKVINAGTRGVDPNNRMIPVEYKMVGRFNSPTVIVDGTIATDNKLNDIVDELDPQLKADRMIVNILNTSIGITVTRKIYAFSQQNHDNYFIYDYVFKNTGIYNKKGDVEPKTLTGVYFFLEDRYAFGLEPFRGVAGWAPSNNITWGKNAVTHSVGTDGKSEVRASFSWYGKHSGSKLASDLGCPNYLGDGHLGATQFVGKGTIHADKSAKDKTDDPLQPATTTTIGSDNDPHVNDEFNAQIMTNEYGLFLRGHEKPTMAEKLGTGYANMFSADNGGQAQGIGYGPYTLAPGDSIHIVLAEAVAGVSRVKSYEIGYNWMQGRNHQMSQFTLPNGQKTSDPDTYKDAWVMTGQDSLIQTFKRASANYKSSMNIPQPPPPPGVFTVTSGGDKISLTWNNSAESWPNLRGYRIFRSIAKTDTFFTKLYECPKGTLGFNDTSARRGFDYYYYIQSFDDGSTNDVSIGTPLVSSKFYTMTNRPAHLLRPASTTPNLADVRVVPNPFDVRSKKLNFDQDRIIFYGLPAECTIRIFSERGDLIQTLEHTNGSADEPWNLLTSSSQVPVSGLYIAYFEVTRDIADGSGKIINKKGESTYRKFIIIK